MVHAWRPRVFRFALVLSPRDRDAAQSVAQDCFLKAYLARQGFRGEASVPTWLMQIAVNLVRGRTRNRRLQFWKRCDAEVDFRMADSRRSPEAEAAAAAAGGGRLERRARPDREEVIMEPLVSSDQPDEGQIVAKSRVRTPEQWKKLWADEPKPAPLGPKHPAPGRLPR